MFVCTITRSSDGTPLAPVAFWPGDSWKESPIPGDSNDTWEIPFPQTDWILRTLARLRRCNYQALDLLADAFFLVWDDFGDSIQDPIVRLQYILIQKKNGDRRGYMLNPGKPDFVLDQGDTILWQGPFYMTPASADLLYSLEHSMDFVSWRDLKSTLAYVARKGYEALHREFPPIHL